MSAELTAVCVLWVLTGMFSLFPDTWLWRVEVVLRNHLIMAISSFYPLFKTLGAESFEEIITIEMLQSLEVVLQSALTLDAFEKAISGLGSRTMRGMRYCSCGLSARIIGLGLIANCRMKLLEGLCV